MTFRELLQTGKDVLEVIKLLGEFKAQILTVLFIVAMIYKGAEWISQLSSNPVNAANIAVPMTYKPGFDCKPFASLSDVKKTVCISPKLSELNRTMADQYLALIQPANSPLDKAAMIQLQNNHADWQTRWKQCAKDTDCLIKAYDERFEYFKQLKDEAAKAAVPVAALPDKPADPPTPVPVAAESDSAQKNEPPPVTYEPPTSLYSWQDQSQGVIKNNQDGSTCRVTQHSQTGQVLYQQVAQTGWWQYEAVEPHWFTACQLPQWPEHPVLQGWTKTPDNQWLPVVQSSQVVNARCTIAQWRSSQPVFYLLDGNQRIVSANQPACYVPQQLSHLF
jgi:uncharacterized protein